MTIHIGAWALWLILGIAIFGAGFIVGLLVANGALSGAVGRGLNW